jgi:DHA1 family tetracycline resistance protein-like MFS transporter
MQGTLQGVIASLNGVAAVLTPLAMTWIFGAFSTGRAGLVFPGAPYLLSALLSIVGVAFVHFDTSPSIKPISRQEAIE